MDDTHKIILAALLANATIKIVCFLLGFQTIKLGYKLMQEGIKGDFKFTANYSGLKGGLVSSSPGLLFMTLGVFLIGYAMYTDKTISYDTNEEGKSQSVSTDHNKRNLPHQPSVIIDSLP